MIELSANRATMREMCEQEFSENMRKHICPKDGMGEGYLPCDSSKAECKGMCCIDTVKNYIDGDLSPGDKMHCDDCETACSGIMFALEKRGLI